MASGVTIQKNYVSSNSSNISLANNWMVLVFGVTSQGTNEPTFVQNYATFENKFGKPVSGVSTHKYVQFLLSNNVPVLFKRIVNTKNIVQATCIAKNSDDTKELFNVIATDTFKGSEGNDIVVTFNEDVTTHKCTLAISKNSVQVENYTIGIATVSETLTDLVFSFISEVSNNPSFDSEYVKFRLIDSVKADWDNIQSGKQYALSGGSETEISGSSPDDTDLTKAIKMLSDPNSSIYTDSRKLLDSATYYPQLRFVTTGGIIGDTTEIQNNINTALGKFAVNCGLSFRVLVDYGFGNTNEQLKTIVRNFASTLDNASIPPETYAYFGGWGYGNNTWLPGSAGFLTSLGLSGYDVYSRRIAGTSFTPAFTEIENKIYIDEIKDWQDSDDVQLNPIAVIDAQDNLAVMGSSTLATSVNTKNPAQALDVVLVSDYVAALLNKAALDAIESSLDRLSLNSLSNTMSQIVERFVASNAITRYNFDFDTTTLGKLDINCTLYFAIGLEEVALTVTSVYDVTATASIL